MGCWVETCAISNLPIEYKEETYMLLLAETPFRGRRTRVGVYPDDFWFVRSIPILGTYNEYGGIDNMKDEWVVKTTHEQFKKDMIPIEQNLYTKSTGAPEITAANMSFTELLSHIIEGSVLIERKEPIGKKKIGIVKTLIRKDVWDLLLSMPYDSWRTAGAITFEMVVKDIEEYIEHKIETVSTKEMIRNLSAEPKTELERKTLDIALSALDYETVALITSSGEKKDNLFSALLCRESNRWESRLSGLNFFKRNIERELITNNLDLDSIKSKYIKLAEVLYVQSIMGILRKAWQPTIGSGSQEERYKEAAYFNKEVAKIAQHEQQAKKFFHPPLSKNKKP